MHVGFFLSSSSSELRVKRCEQIRPWPIRLLACRSAVDILYLVVAWLSNLAPTGRQYPGLPCESYDRFPLTAHEQTE